MSRNAEKNNPAVSKARNELADFYRSIRADNPAVARLIKKQVAEMAQLVVSNHNHSTVH